MTKELIKHNIDNNPQVSKMWVHIKGHIRWKDNGEEQDVVIQVVPNGIDTTQLPEDEEIFFYLSDIHQLLDLCDEDNGEDFVFTDYYFSYM